ncbi:hypothetical protein EV182_008055, partial [Spiromyces aspiralis]
MSGLNYRRLNLDQAPPPSPPSRHHQSETRRGGGGGSGQYEVTKMGDRSMALQNLLFMNPHDARTVGPYGMVENRYIFTIGSSDIVEPGTVAPNAVQRLWTEIELGDVVNIAPFDPRRASAEP